MRFPSSDPQPEASTSVPLDPAPRPPPDVRVLRVSQIDAGRLDAELTSLLREQLLRVFARVHPAAVARRTPELTLGLDLLVFYFTVWSHRPTPGMELMNLRYRDERRPLVGTSGMEGHRLSVAQRLAHGVAFVAGRFLWSKLTRAAHDAGWSDAEPHTWRHRAWRAVGHAENAHAVATLVNLLLFLRSGRFRTPWERLSRARLVYHEPNTARVVSFEYLNRQILWRELSDLALFVLPMLDPARLRDAARRVPTSPSPSATRRARRAGRNLRRRRSRRNRADTCTVIIARGRDERRTPLGFGARDATRRWWVCEESRGEVRPSSRRLKYEYSYLEVW